MDERHRTILRKSRSIFTKDLVDIDTVCDNLYQREILSEGMKNEILSEQTRENQVRKLLDIIPKRGKKAYNIFHQVLMDTQQYEIANILRPEVDVKNLSFEFSRKVDVKPPLRRAFSEQPSPKASESDHHFWNHPPDSPLDDMAADIKIYKAVDKLSVIDEDFVIPTDWPSEPEHAQSLNFTIRKNPSYSNINKCNYFHRTNRVLHDSTGLNSEQAYSMNGFPRGRVVILNNFRYGKPDDADRMNRYQLDTVSLDTLFKQLHFQTKLHSNLTLEKMSQILESERTRDNVSVECFILVILSCGDGRHVYGVDGSKVEIDTIISMFDSEHCSSLKDKPKIFIFQTCDGDTEKENINTPEKVDLTSMNSCQSTMMSPHEEHPVNIRSDMFVLKASYDIPVSLQGVFGSKFIQSFVFLMRNMAYKEDIEEIVQKMNEISTSNKSTNIAESSSSLQKKLFFNP